MAGMNSTRLELDIFMSMAWDRPDVSSFAENAFDFLLQNKGLATEVFATRRARLRSHPSDKIRELLAELDALREQLSRMLLKPHEPEAERDLVGEIYEREVSIGALQRVAEHQEVEATVLAGADVQGIPRVQSQRSRYAQWIKSANNLRDVLPTDTTLIEFVRFQKINPKAWLKEKVTPFYLAFVLSGGETPPRVVRIGTAESVDELVKDLRVSLESDAAEFERGNEVTFEGSRTEKLAARLRAQVLDPVLATAGAANRLLLAPDGSLSMVPFGALPTADGYVLDAYEISYLTSGQDLLRPPAPPDARQEPPVVMADPDYDAGLDGEVVAAEGFTRLAGTRQEGEEVAALLGVSAALGAEATELRLKTVRSPAVLHIATHGWFLPRSDDGSRPAWAEHPRLARLAEDSAIHTLVVRSGLVLAGFNTAWAGADLPESMGDGVFTISDASALELAGTELVALSACDTALGGLISLEGVHGLRRAFLMAGARSSLTTLWKVSDHPTRQLMVDFYRRLRAGIPRATALRDAQLAMRVQTPHPHFWGAFVLHGDHGPLSAGLLNELPDPSPEAERETQLLLALGAIRRGDGTAAEGYLRQSAEDGDLHSAELLANLAEARGDEPEAERWWRKAALAGRPRAAAELGKLLARRNEMQEAERWWKIAIETGSEDEDIVYNLGFINLERGDRDEALRIWRVGAVRNNPRMLRALGIEAANVGDSAEATMWWTRAAEHGEPRAAHTLALAAQKRGDQVELSHWWRRAAELGYPAAAGQLGMAAYENGDYDEACSLWRAAAERGDLDIAYNLGVLLNRLDDPEAEKWWRRAAAAGRPESAYSLARLKKAKGDLRTAAHYWRIAADKGDDRSTVELARLLLAQGGIEEAESRIRPVAERGNADAANLLAQLLVQQEKYAESLQWTETAAAAGQPQAAHQMALIAADGGDRHREMDWWFKAAHAGEAAAVAKVSEMLAAANRPEAEQWLEKAAELGDGGAAVALCQLRFARGDEDGARRALVPAAEQEAEEARMALTLLDADEERIRRLAGRQFASSMRDLSVLAALRGEQETSDHWLMAAADQTNDANTLTEAGEAAMRADDHENAERWLRVAAGQGQPRAAYLLAELSQQQHDQGETAKWLTLAERLSVAEELSRTGQAAFDIGDDDAGTGNWLAAAHRGAADTGARLAHAMFEYGRSRPGDWTNEEAVNLARSAAAAGSAAGACTMGAILTERGNYQEGLTWFDRALRLAHGERPVDDQINTSQLNWSSEE
jgi:CHAT domain-containing protein/tetratricopeptide (TPR) repeat protein